MFRFAQTPAVPDQKSIGQQSPELLAILTYAISGPLVNVPAQRQKLPRHTSAMGIVALWSAPRSRSTAFFRSMLERDDLLALHEPLEGLAYIGPIEIASETFETPQSLMTWLLDGTSNSVFLKETVNRPVLDIVRSNHRFLAEIQHTFLIRRPAEIAASWYTLEGNMRIYDTGSKPSMRCTLR